MLTNDVIAHFGSKVAIARALGIGKASVSKWPEKVPPLRAAQLHKLTRGKLKFDLESYSDWNKPIHRETEAHEHTA
jgi:DNA-binding transcriptional regulator YdaS (Cro superfamily)